MVVPILLLVVSLLAVGEFLLFGALAEAYRSLRQIRENAGILDDPIAVELGAVQNKLASTCGLAPELDSAARAVVVYLDKRCGTCHMILESLGGGLPRGIWLVLVADSVEEGRSWIAETGLNRRDDLERRVMLMSTEEVENHLGTVLTPLAIDVENGRLTRGRTVPSIRQFYAMVPMTIALSSHSRQEVTTQ
jgi:hypothetical protein